MVSREDKYERRGVDSAPETSAESDQPSELQSLLKGLRSDLRGMYGSLRRVVFVEWQRLRMRAVDTYFRAVFYICLLGFALAASISASLLVVSGIKGGIHAWSGAEWVGDFGAGLVIVAVLLIGGFMVRAHLRQEIVRDTKRALGVRKAAAAANDGVKS